MASIATKKSNCDEATQITQARKSLENSDQETQKRLFQNLEAIASVIV